MTKKHKSSDETKTPLSQTEIQFFLSKSVKNIKHLKYKKLKTLNKRTPDR